MNQKFESNGTFRCLLEKRSMTMSCRLRDVMTAVTSWGDSAQRIQPKLHRRRSEWHWTTHPFISHPVRNQQPTSCSSQPASCSILITGGTHTLLHHLLHCRPGRRCRPQSSVSGAAGWMSWMWNGAGCPATEGWEKKNTGSRKWCLSYENIIRLWVILFLCWTFRQSNVQEVKIWVLVNYKMWSNKLNYFWRPNWAGFKQTANNWRQCCLLRFPEAADHSCQAKKKKFSLVFKAVWHLLCAFSVRMSHDLGEETDKMSEFLSCFLSHFHEKWWKRDFQDSGSPRFSSPFLEPISADKDKPPAEPIGREKSSEFHFCFLGFLPKWSSWFLSQADWHSHTLIIIKVMLPG